MAQETKAKSEEGQVQETLYGQDSQAEAEQDQLHGPESGLQSQEVPGDQGQPLPRRTEDHLEEQEVPDGQSQTPLHGTESRLQEQEVSGHVQRTVYGQDDQAGSVQRAESRLQEQKAVYEQDDQAELPRRPLQRAESRLQEQRAVYEQDDQAGSVQRPLQRAESRLQEQRTVYGQDGPAGSAQRPLQRAGSRPQNQGMPGGQVQRTVYGQNGQAGLAQGQPQRTGNRPQGQRVPYGQGQPQRAGSRPQGQRVPYGQGQPQRAGRPQSQRVPYGQAQAGRGGQPAGDPHGQYMQGSMVQRREGHAPGRMMPRLDLSGRQLMEQSKKMFRSPLFVIMTVLCTVFSVTTIASVFLQDMGFSQVVNILANFDAPSELMAYANRILSFMSSLGNGMIVVSLISRLPELFLCAGLWLLVVTSGSSRDSMPGQGFLYTRVYIIIKMIVMCIAMLICLILSVVLVVSAWVSAGLEAKIVSAIFLAAVIVITMMIIMYFFCLLHTVKVCRANAMHGELFSSVSRYAAVLTILAALTSVIGLLSAIVNYETAGIVSFACKIGWMVLAGLWILLYRNKIRTPEED